MKLSELRELCEKVANIKEPLDAYLILEDEETMTVSRALPLLVEVAGAAERIRDEHEGRVLAKLYQTPQPDRRCYCSLCAALKRLEATP